MEGIDKVDQEWEGIQEGRRRRRQAEKDPEWNDFLKARGYTPEAYADAIEKRREDTIIANEKRRQDEINVRKAKEQQASELFDNIAGGIAIAAILVYITLELLGMTSDTTGVAFVIYISIYFMCWGFDKRTNGSYDVPLYNYVVLAIILALSFFLGFLFKKIFLLIIPVCIPLFSIVGQFQF